MMSLTRTHTRTAWVALVLAIVSAEQGMGETCYVVGQQLPGPVSDPFDFSPTQKPVVCNDACPGPIPIEFNVDVCIAPMTGQVQECQCAEGPPICQHVGCGIELQPGQCAEGDFLVSFRCWYEYKRDVYEGLGGPLLRTCKAYYNCPGSVESCTWTLVAHP